MFRVKAVAEMYDVSPATIYRAIESGQLDALRIGTGKGVRVGDAVMFLREPTGGRRAAARWDASLGAALLNRPGCMVALS